MRGVGSLNLRHVAKEAGVHPSTVSRAFVRPELLRPETRAHILAVAAQLGYRPNLVARALAKRTIPLVPLIVPDITNPFFADLARGVEEAAKRRGLHLVLCDTGQDSEREIDYLEDLLPLQIPFLIVATWADDNLAELERRSTKTPIVLVDHVPDGTSLPSVAIDNKLGIHLALDHLNKLGHHSIAFLAGPDKSATADARRKAYSSWMKAHWRPETVLVGGFGIEAGRQAADRLLAGNMEVTAIVAANDLAAIGLMSQLTRADIRVPEDVSIVGFDDLDLASYVRPSLTTVHQPVQEIGAEALSLALSLLHDETERADHQHVILEPGLVVRESTAPPPARTERPPPTSLLPLRDRL